MKEKNTQNIQEKIWKLKSKERKRVASANDVFSLEME
jgi:hypothetical protein